MFENELSKIELCGVEYPYKCDMVVLEKIQKEFGDVLKYEYGIRGLIPYYDEDTGARNKEKDSYTVPDVEMTVKSIRWMIEEGIDIAGSDLTVPDEKEIKRQQDLNISDLSLYAFKEYSKCFLSAMSRSKKNRKATRDSSSGTKK